jgi:hypothetical protein
MKTFVKETQTRQSANVRRLWLNTLATSAFLLPHLLPETVQASGFGAALQGVDSYFRAGDERRARDLEMRRLEFERLRAENELRLQRLRIEEQKRLQEAAEREEEARRQSESQRQADRDEAARARVQAAIDRIPTLKAWQEADCSLWDRAREVDKTMRGLPENIKLSLDQRFLKVVAFVETEAVMSGRATVC